jgi:hypothetical protein
MDVMIRAIKPQLPKPTIEVLTFAKIRSILALEMEKEACQQTKGASRLKRNLALRVS